MEEVRRERRAWLLTWTEFAEALDEVDLAILPVGVVEAHGPHLPLGTDFIIPERLALDLASRLNALVFPAISYGVVGSLSSYYGTLGISQATLESLIFEVLRGLVENGLDRVVILNGHGGSEHVEALRRAVRRGWRELGVKSVVVHWWTYAEDIARKHGIGGGHAGGVEGAAVRAIDPGLVKSDSPDADEIYTVREGIDPFPAPGSVLMYREEESAVVPSDEVCREFYMDLVERLTEDLLKVLEGWDRQEVLPGEPFEES